MGHHTVSPSNRLKVTKEARWQNRRRSLLLAAPLLPSVFFSPASMLDQDHRHVSASYLLCIFNLALVGALPTRDPRMDPIAHAQGKRYVVGRIWGMINWNIHGSVQFEILSRAVHQPVVWMQRRSPSLLVDREMNR